ncbi:hypothetical protein A0H76_2841 [Hepatospora eriocheir]|uniref:Uncharacterized protein n=1 Tax=Hepatospora eriocheir TaxID=1081669 RepID=A0A1X0Q5Q2_9MICR|nr:hypothetical protein A0H76_2841 [Hepatospora eriocheir]
MCLKKHQKLDGGKFNMFYKGLLNCQKETIRVKNRRVIEEAVKIIECIFSFKRNDAEKDRENRSQDN